MTPRKKTALRFIYLTLYTLISADIVLFVAEGCLHTAVQMFTLIDLQPKAFAGILSKIILR